MGYLVYDIFKVRLHRIREDVQEAVSTQPFEDHRDVVLLVSNIAQDIPCLLLYVELWVHQKATVRK